MDIFDIKSKLYCPPSKKDHSLFILINVAVIVIVICSIVSIILNGFSVGNISSCIISILIAILLKKNNKNDGHYEFCMLSISFKNKTVVISYSGSSNKELYIAISTIQSIEYSDKLGCLRLICDYQEILNSINTEKHNSELLLYVKYEDNTEFFNTLETKANATIIFVDR